MQLLLLACEFGFPGFTWSNPPTLLLIFLVFAGCFLLERLVPGWKLPPVPTWTRRVLALNFLQLLVVLLAGVSWEKWFSAYSVFHLSERGSPVVGGMVA